MTTHSLYRIDRLCVIDVGGQDADTILHNLTTNEVKTLEPGQGRETFITNVKGKALSHGYLFREQDRLRFIGPSGPSEVVAEHIDRYTIREDAVPTIVDDQWVAFVVPAGTQGMEEIQGLDGLVGLAGEAREAGDADPRRCSPWQWGDFSGIAYQTSWLGDGTVVLLVDRSGADAMADAIASAGGQVDDETSFHLARTLAGFPWYGVDLSDANLPQEADRDGVAISFTKGCYLGQETIARLDALGQVQKKLVRWKAQDVSPESGTELKFGEKVVARMTSVAPTEDGAVAIAMTRRSHFDPGSTAEGVVAENDQPFTASVL